MNTESPKNTDSNNSSQATAPGAGLFYGYIVVAAAALVMFMYSSNLFIFGVFFKPLLTEFGWTRALTSGAFSLAWVVRGALGIVMGRLNDRLGPRFVTTLCGILMGIGYLLMSQISAVWQFYFFYVVIIGTGSAIYVPMVSTVARWFTGKRGLMTGIVVAGGGLGSLIMPPVANWLISTFNWRISYLIFGSLVIIVIVIAAQFLRRDPDQKGLVPYGETRKSETELESGRQGLYLKEALYTGQFWLISGMMFCFGFCAHTISVHIVPHATDLGISSASAAVILAMIGGLPILGRIALGSIADRIGNKKTIIIGCILISISLVWLMFASETWMLYLFAIVFGLTWCVGVLSSPIIAEHFGLRAHGVIMGIAGLSYGIGAGAGPFIFGYIFDISGSYYIAFLVNIFVAVLGLALTALLTTSTYKAPGKSFINS